MRFPNLVRAVYEEGGIREATSLIGALLAHELQDARLTPEMRSFAAEQFLHMLVTVPQRRLMGFGLPMTTSELNTWADNAVNLFLNGCGRLSVDLSNPVKVEVK